MTGWETLSMWGWGDHDRLRLSDLNDMTVWHDCAFWEHSWSASLGVWVSECKSWSEGLLTGPVNAQRAQWECESQSASLGVRVCWLGLCSTHQEPSGTQPIPGISVSRILGMGSHTNMPGTGFETRGISDQNSKFRRILIPEFSQNSEIFCKSAVRSIYVCHGRAACLLSRPLEGRRRRKSVPSLGHARYGLVWKNAMQRK